MTDTLRDLFSNHIENYIQQRSAKQSNNKGYLSKFGHLFPHTSNAESKTHAARQLQQALVNATNITHKDHNALAFGELGTLFSQVLWTPPYVLHKSLDNVDKKTTEYVLLPNTTVVENSSTTSVTAAQT